ncbi:MAG: PHP domain-containing protein [Dehalococcoidales bacterium]|nr:PHP domain-containing protein [Dehalococcoidales bacterium]
MGQVDLHVHTSVSDGKYTPEEVIKKAAGLGLNYMAICDHDTIDGIAPALKAAKAFPELKIIPGVEVSTLAPGSEVHILGYFIDCDDIEFKKVLSGLSDSRVGRAQAMVDKLNEMGIYIEWKRVRELAGEGCIGRPHIANAMLEKGYISTFKEAFDKYIAQGGPAYVERSKITPAEAVLVIIKAKGFPVLAHPFTVKEPEKLIAELKEAGLVGMEVYYNNYSHEERKALARLAAKYNLVATGGSDYHGIDDAVETMIGEANVPLEAAERLIALAVKKRNS